MRDRNLKPSMLGNLLVLGISGSASGHVLELDTTSLLQHTINVHRDRAVYIPAYELAPIYNSGYAAGSQQGTAQGWVAGYLTGVQHGYDSGASYGSCVERLSAYWRDLVANRQSYDAGFRAGLGAGYERGRSEGAAATVQAFDQGYRAGIEDGYGRGRYEGEAASAQSYEQAYRAGLEDGYGSGRDDAYSEGVAESRRSYDRGFQAGTEAGYRSGRDEAYSQGQVASQQSYDRGFEAGTTAGYDSGYAVGALQSRSVAIRPITNFFSDFSRELAGVHSAAIQLQQHTVMIVAPVLFDLNFSLGNATLSDRLNATQCALAQALSEWVSTLDLMNASSGRLSDAFIQVMENSSAKSVSEAFNNLSQPFQVYVDRIGAANRSLAGPGNFARAAAALEAPDFRTAMLAFQRAILNATHSVVSNPLLSADEHANLSIGFTTIAASLGTADSKINASAVMIQRFVEKMGNGSRGLYGKSGAPGRSAWQALAASFAIMAWLLSASTLA